MSSSALPLKVTPASTPARPVPTTEVASDARTPTKQSVAAIPGEISSPHELTAFVSHVYSGPLPSSLKEPCSRSKPYWSSWIPSLMRCRRRFWIEVSLVRIRLISLTDILLLVAQMSNRVDALENAIQDIISGDVMTPSASPTQFPPAPLPRRSVSGVS